MTFSYSSLVPAWEPFYCANMAEKERCRHIGAFGETGSGKTASVVIPALSGFVLDNRARERTPALVIDPKHELTPLVLTKMADYQEEALLFHHSTSKLWLFCNKDVASISSRDIVDAIMTLSSRQGRWEQAPDPVWIESSKALLHTMISLDRMVFQRRGSMAGVNDFYREFFSLMSRGNSDDLFFTSIADSLKGSDYLKRLHTLIRAISTTVTIHHSVNLKKKCELIARDETSFKIGKESPFSLGWQCLSFYTQVVFDDIDSFQDVLVSMAELSNRPDDTYNSTLFTLDAVLSELKNESLASKICCNPMLPPADYLDCRQMIAEGVVTIYRPEETSPEAGETIGRVLKEQFFDALLAEERLNNQTVPVFYYICDEFQRFMTVDEHSGEQSFLDRCRSYRVCCVLATQSQAALLYKSGNGYRNDQAVNIIWNNIGNKFFFRTTDAALIEILRRNLRTPEGAPHPLDVRGTATLAPGECFYLLANGHSGRSRGNLASRTRFKQCCQPVLLQNS